MGWRLRKHSGYRRFSVFGGLVFGFGLGFRPMLYGTDLSLV